MWHGHKDPLNGQILGLGYIMVGTDPNVVIAAFTEDQVERLTGVSKRQLRYWDSDGFFVPSLGHQNRRMTYSRMYSFRDLVSLKVLNELRNESRIKMNELRRVKDHLSHYGDELWIKTTLYVHNKRVAFSNPDSGVLEEIVSGQGVLSIAIAAVAGDMRKAIDNLSARNDTDIGKIAQKRGVMHNRPVVSGTRIPVSGIKAFSDAGYTESEILKEYPTLTLQDIHAAINHSAAA
jgi:uncharacterized protein (DUF433 family)